MGLIMSGPPAECRRQSSGGTSWKNAHGRHSPLVRIRIWLGNDGRRALPSISRLSPIPCSIERTEHLDAGELGRSPSLLAHRRRRREAANQGRPASILCASGRAVSIESSFDRLFRGPPDGYRDARSERTPSGESGRTGARARSQDGGAQMSSGRPPPSTKLARSQIPADLALLERRPIACRM